MFEFNPWVLTDGTLLSLGLDYRELIVAIVGILIVTAIDLLNDKIDLIKFLLSQNTLFRWIIYFAAIFIVLIFGVYGPDYSQQQFIYFQF